MYGQSYGLPALAPLALYALMALLSSGAFAGSVLTHNGKPFFPIGIYHYPEGLPLQPGLEELSASGFNTVLSAPGAPLDFFDSANRYGIGVIVTLGWNMILSSDDDPKKAILKQHVERLRNHPALLGYEAPDEIAWVDYEYEKQPGKNRDALVRGYAYVKSLDPAHPIWMNHAPRNTVEYLKSYSEAGDVLGTDIYPVPEGYGHSDLDKSLNCVGQYAEKLDQVGEGKPIYMVLQGFEWDSLPGHEKTTWATPQPSWPETRFMAYDAICHGANGIIYWGMRYAKVEDEIWRNLKRIASELRDLSPVLVGGAFSRIPSADPALEIYAKRHEGYNYIFVLNAKREVLSPREIQLPPGWTARKARVLFEQRSVEVTDGRITDAFQAYGVHIYTDDTRPDVSVAIQNPAAAAKNRPLTLQVLLQNLGLSSAPRLNVCLLVEGQVAATELVETLLPGDSRTVELVWTPDRTGNMTLSVVADPEKAMDEVTHTNNAHALGVLVDDAKPDLVPLNLSIQDQNRLCGVILNRGFSDAHDFSASCLLGKENLANESILTLPSGTSIPVCWSIPEDLTGSISCEIAIDPTRTVDELLEGNNALKTILYLAHLTADGAASHVRELSQEEPWIIKYNPAKGTLPANLDSYTLAWGINGWQFPSKRPPNTRRVDNICETVMKRGLDGLWYAVIPTQDAQTLEFKFRDQTEWGTNWDDNDGRGWRIVSAKYAYSLLADLDRLIRNGSAYGADMSIYQPYLEYGWSEYLSGNYSGCLDMIQYQINPAQAHYVRHLLIVAGQEAESMKALGIDLGQEERLLLIAGKLIEAGNYASAEDYLTKALAYIVRKKSTIPDLYLSALLCMLFATPALWRVRRTRTTQPVKD